MQGGDEVEQRTACLYNKGFTSSLTRRLSTFSLNPSRRQAARILLSIIFFALLRGLQETQRVPRRRHKVLKMAAPCSLFLRNYSHKAHKGHKELHVKSLCSLSSMWLIKSVKNATKTTFSTCCQSNSLLGFSCSINNRLKACITKNYSCLFSPTFSPFLYIYSYSKSEFLLYHLVEPSRLPFL